MTTEWAARLKEVVQLRESGKFEAARQILLALTAAYPLAAEVQIQCAWVHDSMGLEKEAVIYYERAIALGLTDGDLCGALLGLGSTLRCIGEYDRALAVLEQGRLVFPGRREFEPFLAMTYYNLGDHHKAMELLLRALAETSQDEGILSYRRALLFYADRLDEHF